MTMSAKAKTPRKPRTAPATAQKPPTAGTEPQTECKAREVGPLACNCGRVGCGDNLTW